MLHYAISYRTALRNIKCYPALAARAPWARGSPRRSPRDRRIDRQTDRQTDRKTDIYIYIDR